jgi:hypothetical protein
VLLDPLHFLEEPQEDKTIKQTAVNTIIIFIVAILIYLYENEDIFNYSTENRFKFFIDKNDKTLEPIKILFYDVRDELKLLLPQNNRIEFINRDCIIELGFNKLDMKQVFIQVEDKITDITELILEVKHNTLEFL